ATEFYKSGQFDTVLLRAVERYDAIMEIMLKTLGEERQATYSPFLPISPTTGRVLYVPMKAVNAAEGTITFDDEDGTETTLPVTGGHVKLQWKPDFGARWAALGVDFEMFGKDHSSNAPVYDRICRALGVPAPEHYVYELFLDGGGQKISKSKGNGLTIDEWLTYASEESLGLFMFQKPRTAKRLHWDVIPRAVDEYHQHLRAYGDQETDKRLANPAFHIHGHNVPQSDLEIPFSMLLNLASAASAEDTETLWGFIRRYAPDTAPATHPGLDAAAAGAVRYFQDFVKPTKTFRAPDQRDRAALGALRSALADWDAPMDIEELQSLVFSIGKAHDYDPLRGWFQSLYEVLLGASQGPRFGGFIALYGLEETIALIDRALAGELVAA
ncbi:MAG: lysine--tRNA ligase, partial [Pseudomonadota bacterium]